MTVQRIILYNVCIFRANQNSKVFDILGNSLTYDAIILWENLNNLWNFLGSRELFIIGHILWKLFNKNPRKL